MARQRKPKIDIDATHWVDTHVPSDKPSIHLQSHVRRELMDLPLEKLQRISELHGCKVEAVYWEIDEHPRRERSVRIRFKEEV